MRRSEINKFSELTGKIIGCSMAVHKISENGFQDILYQRALTNEMTVEGLGFSREHEMLLSSTEGQIGMRRVDFLVEDVISVEIKAVTIAEDIQLKEALNYSEAYTLEVDLLMNFGKRV